MSLAEAWKEICDGPDSVPLEVVGSRHFVSITLQGPKATETLRFHVDTGGNTPGVMLLKSVADRLGFVDEAALPKTLLIGAKEVPLPDGAAWMVVDDVSAEAKKQAVTSFKTRKDYYVGQLGAGFLSRFLVCIDPAGGRLGLADPREVEVDPAGTNWVALMMQKMGWNEALYPFVHVRFNAGGKLTGGYGMLLDTGATASMLERGKVEHQHEKNRSWPYAKGTAGDADMVGGQWPEQVIRVESAELHTPDPLEKERGFPDLAQVDLGPALFVDRADGTFASMFGNVRYTLGSHGAVGNEVWNRFRLLIDYKNERLWIEPTGRQADASASWVRVGVSLAFRDDGCAEVRQITDTNAKATRDKLKIGDVILEIDGVDACKLWHHEISAKLAGKVGDLKKLKVRRGKQTIELSLPVVDLTTGANPGT